MDLKEGLEFCGLIKKPHGETERFQRRKFHPQKFHYCKEQANKGSKTEEFQKYHAFKKLNQYATAGPAFVY